MSLAQLSPLLERSVETEPFHAAPGAVRGDPRHQLGVREVLGAAAHLPDALVTLRPTIGDDAHQRLLQRPGAAAGAETRCPRLVERVHHLAVHVELELVDGLVADPDRVAGDGSQQPSPPVTRLVLVAGVHQRLEGHRRVAQPAEPVVPVPHAAELLGQ